MTIGCVEVEPFRKLAVMLLFDPEKLTASTGLLPDKSPDQKSKMYPLLGKALTGTSMPLK